MARRSRPALRDVVHEVMEPYAGGLDSTRLSLAVDLLVIVGILASSALAVAEYFLPEQRELFLPLELGFGVLFTVEYLLRWYSARDRRIFPLTPFALLDLLALLPTLLALGPGLVVAQAVRGMRLLRVVRLLRLLRVFRFMHYRRSLHHGAMRLRIWASAVNYQYRLAAMGRLLLWAFVAWVAGANLVHLTELQLVGAQGPFGSYWRSYWHILIVLVSGIEDKEPLSMLGRVEVTVLLVFGICIIGMLTGHIVSILVKSAERAGRVAIKPPEGRLREHIVILGINNHLDQVIRQVHAALRGQHYILVVDPEAEDLRITDPEAYGRVFALAGDPGDARVLEQADVETASRVIVLSADIELDSETRDNRSLMRALAVQARDRHKPLVVALKSEESLRFGAPLADAELLLSRRFGECLIGQAVLNPGVPELYDRLMTFTLESNEFYTVPVLPQLVGRTFQQAQLFFLDEYEGDEEQEDVILLGLDRSPARQPNTRLWLNPGAGPERLSDPDSILRADDRLVVMAFELPSFARMTPQARGDEWKQARLRRS